MHSNRRSFLKTAALGAAGLMLAPSITGIGSAFAAGKRKFKLGVSIYAGWMPWYDANEQGVIARWAAKYGIEIETVYMDYVPSIEAYIAGQVDACVMTNMEALDMPAAGGVDSSAIIMGDYSNGNDAIITRGGLTLSAKDLKGKEVFLVEKTVSEYVLARALQKIGLKDSDVKIVNVSDSDIAPSFLASSKQQVVVTWNPMVMEIMKSRGMTKIFTSAEIPGEVQDLCVVNTKVLNTEPNFARALTGAWYEVMHTMNQRSSASKAAISRMAALSKATDVEMAKQLETTAMFYTAQSAVDFTNSSELKAKNDLVRQFCFDHKLLGDNAPSVDVVGIQYPDGTIRGDSKNVKLRYVSTFMAEAAAGKL